MSKRTLKEMLVRSDAFIVTSSSTGFLNLACRVCQVYTSSNEGYFVRSGCVTFNFKLIDLVAV